ncbi:adenine deaminase [Melghirimyces profundicolus]|uniref:adenine deaminase n=1 Tax=Melghirimyces profundicolus TaxID=1242148 RepID=A0A2T6B3J8_9BACL|nr:adenine deaminase C-terminal domain-containing protein [Melghirimyces profundicolus]PTX50646.1 adenine deaminase [Melghirimyces profundicolus]
MAANIREQSLEPLIQTATGKRTPTRVLAGGDVFNVFTGDLERADVALCDNRIAYVGDLKQAGIQPANPASVIDVSGKVLVPGYIEPHAHPFLLYNPVTLAREVVKRGTTTLINDNLFFFSRMKMEEWSRLLRKLNKLPVKMFWWARLDAQARLPESREPLFDEERVMEELSRPAVLQAGELTDWVPLLEAEEKRVRWVEESRKKGIRVEGHAPGASRRTLACLAAAGVTGDHESITAEEVWDRLRLGYMTTLRHSSLRPDLPELIQGLMKGNREVPWHRLMMTTDGPTPPYLKKGFVDYLIRTAIEAGCPPARAYQMATVNPAVYYRLDEHLGAIAPGRVADINVLDSLEEPDPVQVVAEGEPVAKEGHLLVNGPEVDWKGYSSLKHRWNAGLCSEHLAHLPKGSGGRVPVIHLLNPVITKMEWEDVTSHGIRPFHAPGEEDLLVALVDREGKWMTKSLIRGFGKNIDGLASTYNGSEDLLLFGRDPEAMARAGNRALEQGGAITWVQGREEVYNLPLPLGGKTSLLHMEELIPRTEDLVRKLKEFGHPFHDPVYTFLFLSSTHLPQVRLTAGGLVRVKDKKVLVLPDRLEST